jgi:hypothetical protein|tara:strand:+ start:13 stop:546 length:534 start_codon:yes stop_codon:yes gene_type:complete
MEIEFLATAPPMAPHKGECARFKINDQEFEITMEFIGNRNSEIANLKFTRIIGEKKISKTTKQSGPAVFRIFSSITDWYVESVQKHQAKMVIIEGEAIEKGRFRIYDKMVARSADALSYKVHRFIKKSKRGAPRVVFLLYNSEYLEDNSEYTRKLNKELKKLFNIGYKNNKQGSNNE